MSSSNNIGDLLLFNDPRYISLNIEERHSIFLYEHFKEGQYFGSLVGILEGDVIDCGWRAPYGGPDIIKPDVPLQAIVDFLREAVSVARRTTEARTLRVRTRPSYQSLNDASVQFALLNLGFRVETCEIAQGIEVARFTSIEHYIACLKGSQRNQIRRGLASTECVECLSSNEWIKAYDLLALNRAFRGHTLKFSVEYLQKLRSLFPDKLTMLVLRHAGRLIAAALVYRVTRKVDHVVAWGDDRSSREIAPVGCLATSLISRAIEHRVAVLDIGVSSASGVPDDGLISFKRHLLARSDLRLNLVMELE